MGLAMQNQGDGMDLNFLFSGLILIPTIRKSFMKVEEGGCFPRVPNKASS